MNVIPLRFYIIFLAAAIASNFAIYFLAHGKYIAVSVAGGLAGILYLAGLILAFHIALRRVLKRHTLTK